MNIMHFDCIVFGVLYISFMTSENVTYPLIPLYKCEVDYCWVTVKNEDVQNIAKHAIQNRVNKHHAFLLHCFWCSIRFSISKNVTYLSITSYKSEVDYYWHTV